MWWWMPAHYDWEKRRDSAFDQCEAWKCFVEWRRLWRHFPRTTRRKFKQEKNKQFILRGISHNVTTSQHTFYSCVCVYSTAIHHGLWPSTHNSHMFDFLPLLRLENSLHTENGFCYCRLRAPQSLWHFMCALLSVFSQRGCCTFCAALTQCT